MTQANINQKQQLLEWFEAMTAKYSWLSFRYEFSKKLGTFIVGFYPSDKVDSSDEFCMDAIKFEDQMSDLYGDEAPLFGNEEDCFMFSVNASYYEIFEYRPCQYNGFYNLYPTDFMHEEDYCIAA